MGPLGGAIEYCDMLQRRDQGTSEGCLLLKIDLELLIP